MFLTNRVLLAIVVRKGGRIDAKTGNLRCRGYASCCITGNRPIGRIPLRSSLAWHPAGQPGDQLLSSGRVGLGNIPVRLSDGCIDLRPKALRGFRREERSGRSGRLDPPQWAAVDRDLRRSPRALGYTQNLWDGKLLAHHLAQAYGVQ